MLIEITNKKGVGCTGYTPFWYSRRVIYAPHLLAYARVRDRDDNNAINV